MKTFVPCPDLDTGNSSSSLSSSGSSISNSSTFETNSLNAAKLDVQQIADELGHLKKYLNEVELKLNTGVPDCPRRVPLYCEDVPQLTDSNDSRILRLQRNAYKLQQQIGELFDSSAQTKKLLKDLERFDCSLRQMAGIVELRCNALDSTMQQSDHDAALCLQRYKFLCSIFANWNETRESADKMKTVFESLEKTFESRLEYCAIKQKVFKQLADVDQICVYATHQLISDSSNMEDFLDFLLTKTSSNLMKLYPPNVAHAKMGNLLKEQPFASFSKAWRDRIWHIINDKSI